MGHPLKGSQEFLLEDTFRLLVAYLILIFYPIIDFVDDLKQMLATKKHLGTWGPLKNLLVLCIRFRILWKETGLECWEYFDLLQEYIVSEKMAVWIVHNHK